MPPRQSEDAGFFGAIHGLLEEQAASRQNRRGEKRSAFECAQLMAPYDGAALPNSGDFQPVECHDISPKGFSFFAAEQPKYEHVVVALGDVPFRFFAAQLMRTTPSDLGKSKRFLIGCRFVQRLGASLE